MSNCSLVGCKNSLNNTNMRNALNEAIEALERNAQTTINFPNSQQFFSSYLFSYSVSWHGVKMAECNYNSSNVCRQTRLRHKMATQLFYFLTSALSKHHKVGCTVNFHLIIFELSDYFHYRNLVASFDVSILIVYH